MEIFEYCIKNKEKICKGCCECENEGINDPWAILYGDYEEVYGD